MISRRLLLRAAAAATMFGPTFAFAMQEQPFTRAGFEAAQRAGKPILVEIHASWCPTCRAQIPILSRLFAEPQYKNMAVFRVDFDRQKPEVRSFRAQVQSTLIVFKGTEERARSIGDTNPDSIADLLSFAL